MLGLIYCRTCGKGHRNYRCARQHEIKAHETKREPCVPDLIGLGVVARKLTPQEAHEVTEEVMAMGLNDPDARFQMAVIKSIEKVTE